MGAEPEPGIQVHVNYLKQCSQQGVRTEGGRSKAPVRLWSCMEAGLSLAPPGSLELKEHHRVDLGLRPGAPAWRKEAARESAHEKG